MIIDKRKTKVKDPRASIKDIEKLKSLTQKYILHKRLKTEIRS